MKLEKRNRITDINSDFCFSLLTETVLVYNEEVIKTQDRHREAFAPTKDLSRLHEVAPEFVPMVKVMWTDDVIAQWEAKQKTYDS